MSGFPASMKELVAELAQMPGVGARSAERMAFYILRSPKAYSEALSRSILKVKETVRFCSLCNNLSDAELCDICNNASRNKNLLCVVEEPNDIVAIEKAGSYNGLYHVLLGSLSPLDGIGPSDLKIKELVERVKKEKPKEIVVATGFDTEGEATALYIMKVLKGSSSKLTRVAYGIPVGSGLQYADQATIIKAFEGRRGLTN